MGRLKEKLKNNEKKSIAAGLVMKSGRFAKKIGRLLTSRQERAMFAMRKFHAARTQQTTQLTFLDRYPNEFAAARDFFAAQGKKDIRILSYGCCTGEEVVTLRKYFPDAVIVGAEINRESLRICKNRKLDEKIHFIKSKPALIMKYGPYDMVLAMAVLERTPHVVMDRGITDLSEIYPFAKYEKQVLELDSYVKEGGLFVSSNSHYCILDSAVGGSYEVYGSCGFIGQNFDVNSKLNTDKKMIKDMFLKKHESLR